MGEQAKVRVWLMAIEYTGGTVGSDTDFAVTVNGQTVQVTSNIKAGTQKGFDKPLLEEPADDNEAKVVISVKVVEEDVLVDDVGQNQAKHRIVKGWRRQALPPLRVHVQENRGVLGTGATAVFILHFDAEFLATGTVTACRWNGISDKTRTLANYYGQSQRHRRMADYLAGACAYFNLQAAVGHAIGAIKDGVSSPKRWVESRPPSANWMQLSLPIIRVSTTPSAPTSPWATSRQLRCTSDMPTSYVSCARSGVKRLREILPEPIPSRGVPLFIETRPNLATGARVGRKTKPSAQNERGRDTALAS